MWCLPVAAPTTFLSLSSSTRVGHFLSFAWPRPSCPRSLRPQVYTFPSAVSATQCTEVGPEMTERMSMPSSAARRTGRHLVLGLRAKLAPPFRPTSDQSVAPEKRRTPGGSDWNKKLIFTPHFHWPFESWTNLALLDVVSCFVPLNGPLLGVVGHDDLGRGRRLKSISSFPSFFRGQQL